MEIQVKRTRTKGNVIVENIKIDDVHYEYEMGLGIKCKVITLPVSEDRDDDIYWTWTSENLTSGEIITYGVSDKYPHYSSNLYDYEAYKVDKYI